MNLHIRTSASQADTATTQAAEGLPRRKWTLDEIERLADLGFFGGIDRERERFELVGGEIVPMSAKGAWHEEVNRVLNVYWAKALPSHLHMLQETTLRHSPSDFREPDFIFWSSHISVRDLQPADVQLLVEISDSSLDYDLGPKALFYASLGLPDYWVVDAKRLVTRIHRKPAEGGYGEIASFPADGLLTPILHPTLAVRLSDLGLQPSTDRPGTLDP